MMRSSWMGLWMAFGCSPKAPERFDSGSSEPAATDTNEADSGTSSADDTGEPEVGDVIACDEPQLELVSTWTADSLYASTPAEDWPFAVGSCGWGLAVLDLDNDTDEDLLVAGVASSTWPLINEEGRLSPADTVRFDGGLLPAGNGLTVGDFDADGRPDVVLVRSTGLADLVFFNRGNGEFVSTELDVSMGESQHATAFDADGDGDLDLFISRHLDFMETDLVALEAGVLRGDGNQLYRNEGGTFSLVPPDPTTDAASFQAVPMDPDGDGDLDLYLVNDFGPLIKPNSLLKNDGMGGFSPDSDCGCDLAIFGMGATSGDYNNDGHVDLHVSNIGSPRLLMGMGDGTFVDSTLASGAFIEPSDERVTSWATKFIDLDLDGWDDLLTVFGPVIVGIPGDWTDEIDHPFVNDLDDSPNQINAVLRNNEATFNEDASSVGFDFRGASRAVVTGDFDADGLPDAVVSSIEADLTQTVRHYRGQGGCGPGVTIRFPERSGHDVGTKVEWSVDGATLTRWYQPGTTYSVSGSRLHLGLAGHPSADWVRITPFGGDAVEHVDVAAGTQIDQRSYQ